MRWGLIAGVPEEEVLRLISVARRRRFGRGEVAFHRHDPGDSLREEQDRGTVALRRGRTIVLQPDELARRAR